MNNNIFEEICNHLVEDEKPSIYFNSIKDKLIGTPFEVLAQLEEVEQSKEYHPEGNVWNHVMLVINTAAKVKKYSTDSLTFMLGALFHDIGKKATTRKNKKGRWISYDHDKVGAKLTYEILTYYGIGKEKAIYISNLVRYHMHHLYILKNLPFANTNHMLSDVQLIDIILLFLSDKMGRGKNNQINPDVIEEVYSILDILSNRYNANINEIKEVLSNCKKDIIKK